MNFGLFWASSQVTLWTFPDVKKLNPKPEHQNTYTPTLGASAGLSGEHRPPAAGDVQLKGPLEPERWPQAVFVHGATPSHKHGLYLLRGGRGGGSDVKRGQPH